MPSEPWANLLLIDDRSQQLRTIESILGESSQNLAIATSVREALAYLNALDFAVILLRFQMPEMAEIMRQIRQNQAARDTPVIFLVESEYNNLDLERGNLFGTVDYLFEPIVPCVLKAKVAGYLSLYEKTKQVEQLTARLQGTEQQRQEVQIQLEQDAIGSATANGELRDSLEELATEMQLRERQQRAIFESTLDAIAIADDEGRYVEANPAACQLFGLPLSELLGKRISDFMMSDFDFEVAWRAFLANGQGTGELHLRRPDGTVRQVEWVAKANFLPGRHLSALRDITERRQAEMALRDSQRLLGKIADTTPTLLYIYELSQVRNIYINRYGAEFFGYPPEEIQAQGRQFFVDTLAPEHLDKLTKVQERFANAKDGEILEQEFPMRNAKREWRWLHAWEIIFTRNAEGIPEQILGTAIDITEQRKAKEMRHALEAEQELRKRQLRFFSTVSHEFRTPLTSILGVAELLEAHALDWSDEKVARNVQRLKKAARHLNQLLDVLLTINRAESGKLDFHPRPLALAKFCRSLIRECQLTADTKHPITFRCQGQCKNAVMDEKLLYFTLTNLLSNAIKYSPDRSKVRVTLICNPSQAIFHIQDCGIGIPEADRQHLFELFHRGSNSEEIPGTGLGLSVVKTCLDLQGGTIAIDSEVGVGTTVIVTLPLVAEGQGRWGEEVRNNDQ